MNIVISHSDSINSYNGLYSQAMSMSQPMCFLTNAIVNLVVNIV